MKVVQPTLVYTTTSVTYDWAGAVMSEAGVGRRAGAGDAIYMTTSVQFDWAGAVMQKPLVEGKRCRRTGRPTHGGPKVSQIDA